MSVLHFLSYLGILAAASFVVLSLASGLLWISELIEEHTKAAKVVGIRAAYVIIGLHIALYFFDALPFGLILFSIVCHGVYLMNFSVQWPAVSLQSPVFIASCVLAIVNHFLWFFHFSDRSREAHAAIQRSMRTGGRGLNGERHAPSFADVATFFGLCVWLVPLFLFLSLSANDHALPMSAEGLFSPTTTGPPPPASRTSLFKKIIDFVPFIRRKRGKQEGIIILHSPLPSAPSTPTASYSGYDAFPLSNGSPRPSLESPSSPFTASFDRTSSSLNGQARFALRPPPKRSQTDSFAQISDTAVVSSSRSEIAAEFSLRRKAHAE